MLLGETHRLGQKEVGGRGEAGQNGLPIQVAEVERSRRCQPLAPETSDLREVRQKQFGQMG